MAKYFSYFHEPLTITFLRCKLDFSLGTQISKWIVVWLVVRRNFDVGEGIWYNK